MSDIKRSAQSQYETLSMDDIRNLPVDLIAADDSVLALWVPSSMLQEGLDVMRAWGFEHKQTHVWVKVKKSPLDFLVKPIMNLFKNEEMKLLKPTLEESILEEVLAFGMGRLFRQTHELVLIGTRGRVYSKLKNKSQRSVHFGPVLKHSAKPEKLQDMLDIMFPGSSIRKIELFARRDRPGWLCLGNQAPASMGEDIRESLDKLIARKDLEEKALDLLRVDVRREKILEAVTPLVKAKVLTKKTINRLKDRLFK